MLVPGPELHRAVARLGAEISDAYPRGVLLVAVLKGSMIFLADLIRQVTVEVKVDFLAISSYAQGTGRVRLVKDLDLDVAGQDVVLVEDIVDTGLTLAYLRGELGRRGPASLEVCTLLDKSARRLLPADLRFVGFAVPDEFVLGYGLDFAGRYRNLDLIAAGDLQALAEDPDVHVAELYPSRAAGGPLPDPAG